MCEFLKENKKCSGKKKYGDYCYKHRFCYLCDMKDNYIIPERFTNKDSDYTIDQLKRSLKRNKIDIKHINKKSELYKKEQEEIISKIITILDLENKIFKFLLLILKKL